MSELSAPLGRRRARAAKARGTQRRHMPIARLAFAGIVVLLAVVALRVLFVEDPNGGWPRAEVAINSTHNANSIVGSNVVTGPAATFEIGPEVPVDAGSVVTLDGADVVAPADAVANAEPTQFGNLPDLVEDTEHGPIPRISASGERPFDVYARASVSPDLAAGKPLIAIIVTGLGLNTSGTLEAISKLPDTVTLAFAPYGKGLTGAVAAARAEGHEIFLEVPLEPFDYPDNDPGPDTLLTGQAPRDNMDKLYNVMGHFGGYVGLINNMGARFTASGADFGPMMEELGARGLGYIDDGSSNRSLAQQLAQANKVPFQRADLLLDANPARAPILDQLTALERQATESGSAIGIVSALPISVQTVTEWARGLEEKGFIIVPASALMKS
jgi:polysaccharide deacetylase 2 family uncharacterized protein YibQ